jgi:predicted nucleic acid-binding protein
LIAVDTSVLSLAFRRRKAPAGAAVLRLRRAIETGEAVVLPGICLQELLSGVRTEEQFARLSAIAAPFPVMLASRDHHLAASRIANDCRQGGVAVGAIDALIAALCIAHGARLLTTDEDFQRIADTSALRLEPV